MRNLMNSVRFFAPEDGTGATPPAAVDGGAGKGDASAKGGAENGDGGGGAPKDGAPPDKGNGQAPWYGEIDEDLKQVAERFTSPADALRAVTDLRKRESQVRVPGKNAAPEEVTAYRKAIGIPDSPEGYEFPVVSAEEMTDELKESRAGWAKTFHELGISKTAASKLQERFIQEETARIAREKELDDQFAQKTSEALDKEWGAEKARNLEYSNRAFTAIASRAGLDPDELRHIELKDGRFLLDRPEMAKMFAVMGKAMGEGDLGGLVGQEERQTLEAQVEDIRKQIKLAQGDNNNARANRLYAQEQELLARLGNQPIVGVGGRVA